MKKRNLFLTEKRKIRVGQHWLRIRIVRPLGEPPDRSPGVLWIHGGGYQSGSSRDVYVTRAISLTVKFGAVLVSPDYRLSRKHPYPAGLEDCYAALLYLRDHAKELGIREEVNVAYQMPLYPMLDDRDTETSRDNHAPNWNTKRNHKAWKRYLREAWGTDLVPVYAAPARRQDFSGLPPCYTFVGDIEPFYRETADYVENLKKAGVEAEMDTYPDWFHAYDVLFPMKKISREAIGRFEQHFAYAIGHYFAPQPQKKEKLSGGKQAEDMVKLT